MMKRLLLVLGFVLGVVYAAESNFRYQFPTFFAIATNVSDVYFFTNSSADQSALDYHGIEAAATDANLEKCIEENITSSTTIEVGASNASDFTLSCTFAPQGVQNSGFSVTGYGNLSPAGATDANGEDDHPTDGEILVITNNVDANGDPTFVVKATSDNNAPDFGSIKVAAAYVTSTKQLQPIGSTNVDWKDLNVANNTEVFTASNSLKTNYNYFYVIPLVFKIDVNTLVDPVTTTTTMVVTWDAAAQ